MGNNANQGVTQHVATLRQQPHHKGTSGHLRAHVATKSLTTLSVATCSYIKQSRVDGWSERPGKRVRREKVDVLEVLPEYVEAFMAAEPLELRGVCALLHPGGKRAALEAMAAELACNEAGRRGAGLNDTGDRARCQRRGPQAGEGARPKRTAASRSFGILDPHGYPRARSID